MDKFRHDHGLIAIFDPEKKIVKDDVFEFYGVQFPRVMGLERSLLLGNLWLDNEAREAKFDGTWVLEAYGKDYFENLNRAVGEISRRYNANLRSVLKYDDPSTECFLSDLPCLF